MRARAITDPREFYAYQWTQPNVPTSFVVPKCGKWYFRLFTNKCRYDYVTVCEAFIEGDCCVEHVLIAR